MSSTGDQDTTQPADAARLLGEDAHTSPALSTAATVERSDIESLHRDEAIGDLARPQPTVIMESECVENGDGHGRTYDTFRRGRNTLPNGTEEQGRLNHQHDILMRLMDGNLYLAPLDPINIHNVLDIGTGTGSWAIDFAQRYPSAKVIGSDLTPSTPLLVPPNCSFEIHDAEEDDWSYSTPFDYVHGRLIITCFADPLEIIYKCFDNLKPGGYLEIHDLSPLEFEGDVSRSKPIRRWMDLCIEASTQNGRPWNNAVHFAHWMHEVGFEDVEERLFKLPSNPYEGLSAHQQELGRESMQNLSSAVEALSLRNFTRTLGWTPAGVRELAAAVRRDLSEGVKAYCTARAVWGRKPL